MENASVLWALFLPWILLGILQPHQKHGKESRPLSFAASEPWGRKEKGMSKYDRSPWQERLIEKTFDVVKSNKCLPARLINEIVIFKIGQRLSAVDKKLIKRRLGWCRTLLAATGYLKCKPGSTVWELADGGVLAAGVVGTEVIAIRSAMRHYLY